MAKDGLFFKQATELNKNQVPASALQCVGVCALYFGKVWDLLTYATFASLLFYILTILGVFILRKKNLMRIGLTKLGYPFVPALIL
jgi:APA family basic amino acid/polyamine antiporter